MKKFFAILIAVNLVLLGMVIAPPRTARAQLPSYVFDPCQYNSAVKSSVVINIASATTTQLVALATGKQVFVCGFSLTMVGATETFQLEYGTGASCGTGTTVLTGAFADGTVSDLWSSIYPGSTITTAIAGNALCAVTTGGTVSIQGVLTYVQQ